MSPMHDDTKDTTKVHDVVEKSVIQFWESEIFIIKTILSYDVTSGSEITPCNKIDKPLVVNRFSGNVMMSITMLCT